MKIDTLAVLATRRSEATAEHPALSGPPAFCGARGDLLRVEMALAAMEGGAEAAVFSSGLAATWAVLQTLSPGDHVIASAQIHGGTRRLMNDLMAPWGLNISFVDTTKPDEVAVALEEKTKIVWIESPSGLTLKVTEISRIAGAAHRVGALCVVDNTSTTPVLQRPIEHRADIVMHLTTSYISGHGESRGGVVVVAENGTFFDQLRSVQAAAGANPSPFDAWLICQGLPSLPIRMRASCETASELATYLWGHQAVEEVYYPGLAGDSGNEIARRQMNGFGTRISFTMKDGFDAAFLVASSTRLISSSASAGSSRTRLDHLVSVDISGEEPPENMLRLSVGLEDATDLIADLDQALPK